MSPEFLPVPKKHKRKYRGKNHLRFRVPAIFKAKLKELAFKRHTTPSKILRAYLRYCLEKKEDLNIELPLEKDAYWCEWMHS